jgi:osmotically-inducible protein OsmY
MNTKLFIVAAASALFFAPVAYAAVADDSATMDPAMTSDDVMMMKTEDAAVKAVNAALANDPNFSSFAIVVNNDNGKVTLSGNVDTEKTKSDIEAKIKNIDGVTSVVNNLTVNTPAK